jgi:putative transposase
LGLDRATRLAAYRDLFRSELDEKAIEDIRLALQHGQPLGSEKFQEAIALATDVRRTRLERGRPRKTIETSSKPDQPDFGF